MIVLPHGEEPQELGRVWAQALCCVQGLLVLRTDLILSRVQWKWTDCNIEQLLYSVPSLRGPVALKLSQYSIFHVLSVIPLWK